MEIEKVVENITKTRNLYKIERFVYSVPDSDVMQIVKGIGNHVCGGHFVIDDNNRDVYRNTINWLLGKPFVAINPQTGEQIVGNHSKGLFIAGNTGSGKSMFLTILAAVSSYFRVEYEYGRENRALQWCDHRADELCNQFILSGADIVVESKRANVLCLNDIGSEPTEQMYMGNRVNIIRQILEARGDQNGQFTLITSNYPMLHQQLAAQYGDRVISRLQGMCNYFVLSGKDRRTY